MDAELKAKWVRALRSGEYRQGRDRLRVETGGGTRHCCWGVLCEVMPNPPREWRAMDTLSKSRKLLDRLGLSRETVELLENRNDGTGMKRWSFKRLATWAEKSL